MQPPTNKRTDEENADDDNNKPPNSCFACLACGLYAKLPQNPEVIGWVLVRVVMAMVVVHSSITFGPSLLEVAKESVGCPTSENECHSDKCTKRMWGLISSSSYLSVTLTISSLLMAILSPLLGTWCDFTNHRKAMTIASLVVAGVLMLSGVVIQPKLSVLLFLFIATTVFQANYSVMTLGHLSYLTELTPHPKQNSPAVTVGYIWMFSSEIVAAAVMIAISSVFGLSAVGYARLSSILFGTISLLLVIPASILLLPRQAARVRPPGISIPQYSFVRLYQLQKETRERFPDLARFFCSVLVFDPASNALVVLAATYLVDQLCFAASDVSVVVAVSLVATIPGLRFAGHFFPTPKRAKRALLCALVTIACFTLLAPFVLTTKSLPLACLFGLVWGFLLSVIWLTSLLLTTQLTPGGQEAEIAGLALFSYKALQWLPPLMFTLLNEVASIKFGLASLAVYFLLGALVLSTVHVGRGSACAEQTLEHRRSFWHQNVPPTQPAQELTSSSAPQAESEDTQIGVGIGIGLAIAANHAAWSVSDSTEIATIPSGI